MATFGNRLSELRKQKNLKQKDVADHFGMAVRTYQNYEGGQREPNFSILVALADYFDVTTDYLLGRTDEPKQHSAP